MISIPERIGSEDEFYRTIMDNLSSNLRVCIPGIIQSFDATNQTVTVQPVIRENIRNTDLSQTPTNLPLLLDVPIVVSKGGGYILTMPVQHGDECLVIFADMCIDAWFSNGGVQNQIEKRRHDLSDGFAILGIWSQPNKISNYSTNSAQLRSISGTSYIDLKENEINIVSPSVKINGHSY